MSTTAELRDAALRAASRVTLPADTHLYAFIETVPSSEHKQEEVRASVKARLHLAAEFYETVDNLDALFRRLWDARCVVADGAVWNTLVYCLPIHPSDTRAVRT